MENGRRLSGLALAGLAAGRAAGLQACDKGRGGETGGAGNMQDTSGAARPAADPGAASAKHACRGLNECRGQGGCAVTGAQLKELAAKAGVPLDSAGSPHDCKGKNACKGLGGCNM